MIDDDVILAAYRLLLDREPESKSVVGDKRAHLTTLDDVVVNLVCSNEFLRRNRDVLLITF
jgi:hypothetical protein